MHRFLSGTDDLSAVISERTIPFLDDGLIVSLNDCGKLFAFQPPRSFAAHRAPIQAGPLFSADALREPAKGERDPDRLIEAAQDARCWLATYYRLLKLPCQEMSHVPQSFCCALARQNQTLRTILDVKPLIFDCYSYKSNCVVIQKIYKCRLIKIRLIECAKFRPRPWPRQHHYVSGFSAISGAFLCLLPFLLSPFRF